jgi:hypothetical protein
MTRASTGVVSDAPESREQKLARLKQKYEPDVRNQKLMALQQKYEGSGASAKTRATTVFGPMKEETGEDKGARFIETAKHPFQSLMDTVVPKTKMNPRGAAAYQSLHYLASLLDIPAGAPARIVTGATDAAPDIARDIEATYGAAESGNLAQAGSSLALAGGKFLKATGEAAVGTLMAGTGGGLAITAGVQGASDLAHQFDPEQKPGQPPPKPGVASRAVAGAMKLMSPATTLIKPTSPLGQVATGVLDAGYQMFSMLLLHGIKGEIAGRIADKVRAKQPLTPDEVKVVKDEAPPLAEKIQPDNTLQPSPDDFTPEKSAKAKRLAEERRLQKLKSQYGVATSTAEPAPAGPERQLRQGPDFIAPESGPASRPANFPPERVIPEGPPPPGDGEPPPPPGAPGAQEPPPPPAPAAGGAPQMPPEGQTPPPPPSGPAPPPQAPPAAEGMAKPPSPEDIVKKNIQEHGNLRLEGIRDTPQGKMVDFTDVDPNSPSVNGTLTRPIEEVSDPEKLKKAVEDKREVFRKAAETNKPKPVEAPPEVRKAEEIKGEADAQAGGGVDAAFKRGHITQETIDKLSAKEKKRLNDVYAIIKHSPEKGNKAFDELAQALQKKYGAKGDLPEDYGKAEAKGIIDRHRDQSENDADFRERLNNAIALHEDRLKQAQEAVRRATKPAEAKSAQASLDRTKAIVDELKKALPKEPPKPKVDVEGLQGQINKKLEAIERFRDGMDGIDKDKTIPKERKGPLKDQLQEQINRVKDEIEELKGKITHTKTKPMREIPMSEIDVDPARFQPRVQNIDEPLQQSRVKDFNRGLVEANPVKVWRDPKDGRLKILAGHHRYDLFNRVGEKSIPAIEIEGTEAEAVDYAMNEQQQAKSQTSLDRANYYRKMREAGKSQKEIDAEADRYEGRNKNAVLSMSYLNPKGRLVEDIASLGDEFTESGKIATTMAQWIGSTRRAFPELTDLHEEELYDFLKKNYRGEGKDFRRSGQFQDFVEAVINKRTSLDKPFDPKEPLNLESLIPRSPQELEIIEGVRKAKKDFDGAKKIFDEKKKEFQARSNDLEKVDAALKPYRDNLAIAERDYLKLSGGMEAALNALKDQQVSLFDEIEQAEKEARDAGHPEENIAAGGGSGEHRSDEQLGQIADKVEQPPSPKLPDQAPQGGGPVAPAGNTPVADNPLAKAAESAKPAEKSVKPKIEAIAYIRAIKNPTKRAYAEAYHDWVVNGRKGDPPAPGKGTGFNEQAAISVRTAMDEKFYPTGSSGIVTMGINPKTIADALGIVNPGWAAITNYLARFGLGLKDVESLINSVGPQGQPFLWQSPKYGELPTRDGFHIPWIDPDAPIDPMVKEMNPMMQKIASGVSPGVVIRDGFRGNVNNPVNDALAAITSKLKNVKWMRAYVKSTLRGIKDATPLIDKAYEPIKKQYFPLYKELMSKVHWEDGDVIPPEQGELESVAFKGPKGRGPGYYIDKGKEAEVGKIWEQMEPLLRQRDQMTFELARKHADVRIFLDADGKLPKGINISADEHARAMKLRDLNRTYVKPAMEKVGVRTRDDFNMPYEFDRSDAGRLSLFDSEVIPKELQFKHRDFGTSSWMPSAQGSMARYIPNVTEKIAFNNFYRKWEPFFNSKEFPPELRNYIGGWIKDGIHSKSRDFPNEVVNAVVSMEFLRLMGMGLSAPYKHLFKYVGNASAGQLPATFQASARTLGGILNIIPRRLGLTDRVTLLERAGPEFTPGRALLNLEDEIPQDMANNLVSKMRLYANTVAPVEWMENAQEVLSTLFAAAGHPGVDPITVRQAIFDRISRFNFRAGPDQPLAMRRSAAVRALSMFQMTPWKLMEQKLELAHDAMMGKKDVFGDPATMKLLRMLFIVGTTEAVARRYGYSVLDKFIHIPFIQQGTGPVEPSDENKFGVKIDIKGMRPSLPPLIQLYNEMAKEGIAKGIMQHYTGADKSLGDISPYGGGVYEKITRIKKDEIPDIYEGSKPGYMLSQPKMDAIEEQKDYGEIVNEQQHLSGQLKQYAKAQATGDRAAVRRMDEDKDFRMSRDKLAIINDTLSRIHQDRNDIAKINRNPYWTDEQKSTKTKQIRQHIRKIIQNKDAQIERLQQRGK